MSPASPQPNPFKALRPYDPGEPLFGREGDLSLVLDRVLSARTTLLFAGSGVGKTSFLNAKLIPYLERRRYLVCAHNRWAGTQPLEAVQASVVEALARKNPTALGPGTSAPAEASLARLCQAMSPARTVLVLDQFEEVFQYHRDTPYFESFVDALAELINSAVPEVRLVFCMREEFLGELSAFDNKIPDLFNNYYRLKNPTAAQASDIISDTAAIAGVKCDTDGLRRLVADLRAVHIGGAPSTGVDAPPAGGRRERHYVPPPYLQIACYRLWSRQGGEASPDAVATRFLARYAEGDAQRELEGYCEEKLRNLPHAQQELACDAFDFLMTKQGAKMAYELSNLAQHMKVDPGQLQETLTALSHLDVRLLRRSAAPDGSLWFELYHDMYAPFICEWKECRRRGREEQQRQQERERVEHAKAVAVEAWRRSLRRRVIAGAFALLVLGLAALPIVQARRNLSTLGDPTAPYASAARAYASLQSGPFARAYAASAQRLWAELWARLANQAHEQGRIDDELLFRLNSLAVVDSVTQRQQVKRLLGGDYRHLQATYRARGPVQKLAYTSNGTVLASTLAGTVPHWSIDSGRTAGEPVLLQGARKVLAFSGDTRYALALVNVLGRRSSGKTLPVEAGETLALLDDGDVVKQIPLLPDQQLEGATAAFRGDGRAAALAMGKIVRVISVPEAAPIGGLLEHDADVVAVAFAPHGEVLATATAAGVISLWNVRSTTADARMTPSKHWTLADGGHGRAPTDRKIRLLVYRPDGDVLLSSTLDGIQLWQVHSGTPTGTWMLTPDPVVVAAFRDNHGELLIGTANGVLEVRNIVTGTHVDVGDTAQSFRPLYLKSTIAVSPDGLHVLTADRDGVIRRWSPEPQPRVELEVGMAPIAWSERVKEWQGRLALVVVNDGRPVPMYPPDEFVSDPTASPSPGAISSHLAEGRREAQRRPDRGGHPW